MAGRGELTPAIRAFMEGFLGRETSNTELHLLPYLQYQMINEQRLDPKKINVEERAILQLLREAGHIEGGMSGLEMTREFWDFTCRVLWASHVDYEAGGVP